MILFLHHRYRVRGGEERAVDDLMWLVRSELGEEVQALVRDSAPLGRARAAAGLLAGGADPGEVEAAVRRLRARVVHAHNLNPTLGWRALAAGRAAGARVVLHLHNYRLVCAVGVCFTRGEECTRCHGRHTWPGVQRGCRGSRVEAGVYAASLALWQRRLTGQADAVIVPSRFAAERLELLQAPVDPVRVHVVPPALRAFADASHAGEGGYALLASRLAPEKGVETAIDACRAIDLPLVVAGEGPLDASLRERARGAPVRFAGAVDAAELGRLRAGASLAIVPSRSAETFGLAAAEAMALGVPVVASRVGALSELVPEEGLVPAGDAGALAQAAQRLAGDAAAGERALAVVRERLAPARIGTALRAAYGMASEARSQRIGP
jgi:glycosyltransferase involved in cell wall biosynthesis